MSNQFTKTQFKDKGKPANHRFGLWVTLAIVASIGLSAAWQFPNYATAQVASTDILCTMDADFDQGTLVSVNHDAPFSNGSNITETWNSGIIESGKSNGIIFILT